jgi:hypothetical protein
MTTGTENEPAPKERVTATAARLPRPSGHWLVCPARSSLYCSEVGPSLPKGGAPLPNPQETSEIPNSLGEREGGAWLEGTHLPSLGTSRPISALLQCLGSWGNPLPHPILRKGTHRTASPTASNKATSDSVPALCLTLSRLWGTEISKLRL